jgi:large subunit ribosomal protein L23
MTGIDFIHRLILTTKSSYLFEMDQYSFEVDPKATKPFIKKFFEEKYQVKVESVHTHTKIKRKKQLQTNKTIKTKTKIAILKLKPGYTLDFQN